MTDSRVKKNIGSVRPKHSVNKFFEWKKPVHNLWYSQFSHYAIELNEFEMNGTPSQIQNLSSNVKTFHLLKLIADGRTSLEQARYIAEIQKDRWHSKSYTTKSLKRTTNHLVDGQVIAQMRKVPFRERFFCRNFTVEGIHVKHIKWLLVSM